VIPLDFTGVAEKVMDAVVHTGWRSSTTDWDRKFFYKELELECILLNEQTEWKSINIF
jgi:hypothetical protein